MRIDLIEEKLKTIDITKEAPETEPDRQYYFIKKLKPLVAEKIGFTGRPLTYKVTTFGCQMNAKDSEKLAGILEMIGYKEAADDNCDFVIYNTCTVRENANLKIYGRLGYLSKLKKKNPNMVIALCGCMMQEKQVVEKIKTSYKFVDIVFGTHNIYQFAELIYTRFVSENKKTLISILEKSELVVEALPTNEKYGFKAGVNIMYGCNNFCTFCIVPKVRGREKSRKPDRIVEEVKELVAGGIKEVMLLGQNVNSYGNDNKEIEMDFADLLTEVSKVEGLKRIRFMSPHPKDFSDKVIDVIANNPKVCNHVHMPLQSGSSRLLKKMNRCYDKDEYMVLVKKIKERIPNVALTTDIIVGFPGETEEDFLETMDVCRQAKFSSAYTFQYSVRTGTPAAKFPDQVPADVMQERFDRLLELMHEVTAEEAMRFTGMDTEVLVEEYNEEKKTLTGRMDNNMLVHFEGCPNLLGELVTVHLDECKGFYYFGTLVNN